MAESIVSIDFTFVNELKAEVKQLKAVNEQKDGQIRLLNYLIDDVLLNGSFNHNISRVVIRTTQMQIMEDGSLPKTIQEAYEKSKEMDIDLGKGPHIAVCHHLPSVTCPNCRPLIKKLKEG